MASVTVHESSTHIFKLQYDSFTTAFNEQRSQVTVTLKNVKMINENSGTPFNFSYKTFLVAEFIVNEKSQLIGANKTSEYYYFDEGFAAAKGKRVYSSSYPDESISEFAYKGSYKAPYLLAFLEAEYVNSAASREWSSISVGTKTFTIKVPDGAEKVQFYIYGDSDALYRYMAYAETPNIYQWYQSISSCPCQPVSTAHDTVTIESPVDIIVEPISTNTFLEYYVENGVPGVKTDEDRGAPTTAVNNHNNTFNAVIRPFKKGTNNPIEHIRGVIQFRKDGVPTGDYYKVPVGTSFNRKVATKLTKNADGSYTKLEDYEYSLINGTGAYVKDGDVYKDATTGLDEDKLTLTSTDNQLYYRAVLESVETKNLTLDSAKTSVDFYLNEWLEAHNDGTASSLNIDDWPLAITPRVFNNGKTNQRTILCGTSAVWIDLYAKAKNFIPTGLTTIEVSTKDAAGNSYTYDTYYISIENYENPTFYESKSYSYEYFDRAAVYTIDGNNTVTKETRPAFDGIFDGIPSIEGTDSYKKSHYYAANRNTYGADLRKSKWLNTSFYSIPRAPRQLWYESTRGNETYVSDEYAEGINSNIYKEDLRPRIKDTFTWRWDQAFGDISNPMEPTNYRVFIYLRTKKQKDTKKLENLTALTGLGDGYLYYSVDCLNFIETTDANGKTKQTFTGITNTDGITRTTAGSQLDTDKQIPCFEVRSKYIKLDLKALGFESGDYCGCRVYSFVVHPTKGNLYSETSGYSSHADIYNSITTEPADYTLVSSTRSYGAENDDKSLYGTGGYSSEKSNGTFIYSPDKSFAEGGCPSIDSQYDYIESFTDCKVRNGATVWVKISDTNEPEKDWVEGTPWVKTNEGWKEADSLHVKTNTSWKESD